MSGYFYNNYRYNAKTEILDNEKKEINDKVNKSNGKITFLKNISGTKSITTDTQSATTNSTK